jgi:hypothetical protein
MYLDTDPEPFYRSTPATSSICFALLPKEVLVKGFWSELLPLGTIGQRTSENYTKVWTVIFKETAMNKEQFLQTLQTEQALWEAFLTSISVAQREQAGIYGTWSVKDVIGHVAAWERYMTGRLQAHLRNDAATPNELWGEFIPPDE